MIPLYGTLAQRMIKLEALVAQEATAPAIRAEPVPYQVWGSDLEETTLNQMDNAAHLPISQKGALMPDGHPGYGFADWGGY